MGTGCRIEKRDVVSMWEGLADKWEDAPTCDPNLSSSPSSLLTLPSDSLICLDLRVPPPGSPGGRSQIQGGDPEQHSEMGRPQGFWATEVEADERC